MFSGGKLKSSRREPLACWNTIDAYRNKLEYLSDHRRFVFNITELIQLPRWPTIFRFKKWSTGLENARSYQFYKNARSI